MAFVPKLPKFSIRFTLLKVIIHGILLPQRIQRTFSIPKKKIGVH